MSSMMMMEVKEKVGESLKTFITTEVENTFISIYTYKGRRKRQIYMLTYRGEGGS